MFTMTSVCGCGWTSAAPQEACRNCGQAICPQCGNHSLSVAAWPEDSPAELQARVQRHFRDVVEQGMGSLGVELKAVRPKGRRH